MICILIAGLMLSCKKSKSDKWKYLLLLGKSYFTGTVTGRVLYEFNDLPIEGVEVKVVVRGGIYTVLTGSDGTFSLDVEKVRAREGYNVNFSREQYDDLTRAAVFQEKGVPVDLGDVYMTDMIAGAEETRSISGRVLDNHGSAGLPDATVTAQNSHYETVVGVTDGEGNFELSGHYFMIGSSYAVTVSKEHYIADSSVTVTIAGAESTIDGNPVRLYREYGAVTGTVMDDLTDDPLAGAAVSAVDGRGNTVTAETDSSGNFRLGGTDFYVSLEYEVAITKAGYHARAFTLTIDSTEDNPVSIDPVKLMINGSVSGVVKNPSAAPITGVSVEARNDAHQVLATTTTGADGSFTLASDDFRKNVSYALYFTHAVYENSDTDTPPLQEGNNGIGTVTMEPRDFTGYAFTGVVADDWDGTRKLPASISIMDQDGITRTATADGSGSFTVTGNFVGGTGYILKVSHTGYTGDVLVERREIPVEVDGSSPQSLGQITLFPIGIRALISGQKHEFSHHVKQTRERFLTGNTGFTLSARNGTDLNTASTFYLHTDDPDQPASPDGEYTAAVAVNGAYASGYLQAGIAEDPRTALAGMTSWATHHFYVSDGGDFTVQTFGSTDTYLEVYDGDGNLLEGDDDGGDGANGRVDANLGEGWYFARVRGTDDGIYGFYELGVSGPNQVSGMTGSWNLDEIILSWYDCGDSRIYIAGHNEPGSAGGITISMMQGIGGMARGSFSGTMRAVTQTGATVPVTEGYFNLVRSE